MKRKEKKGNEQAINSTELIIAMEELQKESGIQKEYLLESIETALVTAYKKNYECEEENVKITMDKETGEIHVYMQKEIVKEVENEKTQMSLEEAKTIDKKFKVGDIYEKEYTIKTTDHHVCAIGNGKIGFGCPVKSITKLSDSLWVYAKDWTEVDNYLKLLKPEELTTSELLEKMREKYGDF